VAKKLIFNIILYGPVAQNHPPHRFIHVNKNIKNCQEFYGYQLGWWLKPSMINEMANIYANNILGKYFFEREWSAGVLPEMAYRNYK
jgi:hypothetical protein